MKGLIFNIQRYSLNDGEGIRTIVFFKGCPLTCPWCSNPESQKSNVEMMRNEDRCRGCTNCENDEYECPTNAYNSTGKWYNLDEIIFEIKKDMQFYQASGGGVTLSGGEVLMQSDFATMLLKELRRLGINTAIETCGMGNSNKIEDVAKYCNEVLFDLKIMDNKECKEVISGNINLIKKNLEIFQNFSDKVIIRFPFIPYYTDQKENIDAILDYMNEKSFEEIHILPFHQYGSNKYKYLNKEYELEEIKPPSEESVENLKQYILDKGFKTIIGG